MMMPRLPYLGLPVNCTWCAYEVGHGRIYAATVQLATYLVETPLGVRELCDRHATAERWSRRKRRVGKSV